MPKPIRTDVARRARIRSRLREQSVPGAKRIAARLELRGAKDAERSAGWSLEHSTLLFPGLIESCLQDIPSRKFIRFPLRVLCLGGHDSEILVLKRLLAKHGFSDSIALESSPPASGRFEVHQTSLTSKFQARDAVFHEGISTLNLDSLRNGKKLQFDWVLAQNSFYPHNLFSDAFLRLYRVLRPNGRAFLFFDHRSYHSPLLETELADLKNHFSVVMNRAPDGALALMLTKKPLPGRG
ncbi:MAG: class I SAM-dependent methyltransferase [Candidatus Diapherotrites archaeon]|nr:class I SAM-dependent methyltransferase [Candidatus Diapherotrites archaeon]